MSSWPGSAPRTSPWLPLCWSQRPRRLVMRDRCFPWRFLKCVICLDAWSGLLQAVWSWWLPGPGGDAGTGVAPAISIPNAVWRQA